MRPSFSFHFTKILDSARALASHERKLPGTEHVLLAILDGSNHAASLLGRHGVDSEDVEDALDHLRSSIHEPQNTIGLLESRSRKIATGSGAKATTALHLLASMLQLRQSAACRLLEACGVDLDGLRRDVGEWIAMESQHQLPPAGVSRRVATGPTRAAARQKVQRPRTKVEPERSPRRPETREPRTPRPASPWSLDQKRFPILAALCRNITEAAARSEVDPLIGRERELEEVMDILHKRRANNPCLIGEPGVGKTAIAEGLAHRIVSGRVPESMKGRLVLGLEVGRLVSGTHLRGSFNERMRRLKREVSEARDKVIVFIDEIHTLLGAGASGDAALDAAGELKEALARGEFPCLGATTTAEYRKYIEADPALERRFHPVVVEEPDQATAREIIQGVAGRYEAYHGIEYTPEALDAAVGLSSRYLTERFLPDKAINLLDLAAARARRKGLSEVGIREVAEVVSRMADIPMDRLTASNQERFLSMETELARRIVGHRHVIERISHIIRRAYAGFTSDRPVGSFLFLGPTGVGKTEMVKVLADFLFHSRDAIVRLDMSEYMEQHSVSRMIGSPPGYVGFEEGGQLTEAIRRRPYQIVLLDEVEKAHRDVLNLLLQILDEGHLTDGHGRTVDFTNTVVIMTSNLGSEHYRQGQRAIGFGSGGRQDRATMESKVLAAAKAAFPLELWNRIEERLVFAPLGKGDVAQVARLLLEQSSSRLAKEKGISFEADDAAIDYLIQHGGFSPELGARPMRQTIQRLVEAMVAEAILAGRVESGTRLLVTVSRGALTLVPRPGDPPASSSAPR